MSSHHDNHNHSTENKPVSFTVPLILGLVTVAIMVALVSIGDPCHCNKECAENCSTECKDAHRHPGHEAAAGHEAASSHEAEVQDDQSLPVIDTADDKEAAPTPEHNPAEHGH
jgi:hypothetical protein